MPCTPVQPPYTVCLAQLRSCHPPAIVLRGAHPPCWSVSELRVAAHAGGSVNVWWGLSHLHTEQGLSHLWTVPFQTTGERLSLSQGGYLPVSTEEGEPEAKMKTLTFHLGGASPRQRERRRGSEVGKNTNDVWLC